MRRALVVGAGALVVVGVAFGVVHRADAPRTAYTGGHRSYAESMSETQGDSRSVLDVHDLSSLSEDASPLLAEGRFVAVEPDRGWRNLPEEEITESADTQEVDFFGDEAAFRTILVKLEISNVLRPGGLVPPEGHDPAQAEALELTFVLHNDTSLEAAREELLSYPNVIVPLAEVERGAFGLVTEPYGGSDMVISEDESGHLDMPLAEDAIQAAVLGSIVRRDDLVRALTPR